MALGYTAFGGSVKGSKTATADTAFVVLIQGRVGVYTRLAGMQYTAGNTAHNVTVMRPIGRANVTTAVNSGTADLTLDANPSPSGNTIAANDYVAVEHADGTHGAYLVNTSGWNGTSKVLTLSTNLTAAVAAGAKFFMFGIATDTDPATGSAHPKFPSTANTDRTYTWGPAGVSGHNKRDPLLIYSGNATNAGTLNYAEYAYTRE